MSEESHSAQHINRSRHIRLISTGGTIAGRIKANGRYERDVHADVILNAINHRIRLGNVKTEDYARAASFDLSIDEVFNLACHVDAVLNDERVCGVVVTQGTAVMEEVAYAVDIMMTSQKPVVFTGSMRTIGDVGWDGPRNVYDSLLVAGAPNAWRKGTMVVFGGEVHAARDVVKIHNTSLHPYSSPTRGPLGIVEGGTVQFHREPAGRATVRAGRLEVPVYLVRICAGFDVQILDTLLTAGPKGLVIEGAAGTQGIPSKVTAKIRSIVATCAIPIVITSRALAGRIRPPADLDDLVEGPEPTVFIAQQLAGPKARMLLMAGLGARLGSGALRQLFEAVGQ